MKILGHPPKVTHVALHNFYLADPILRDPHIAKSHHRIGILVQRIHKDWHTRALRGSEGCADERAPSGPDHHEDKRLVLPTWLSRQVKEREVHCALVVYILDRVPLKNLWRTHKIVSDSRQCEEGPVDSGLDFGGFEIIVFTLKGLWRGSRVYVMSGLHRLALCALRFEAHHLICL